MKYKTVLFDIDGTLIDFEKSEAKAIKRLFLENNIIYSVEIFEEYKTINHKLWKELELGLLTKTEVMHNRFEILFKKYNYERDIEYINNRYQLLLGDESCLFTEAIYLLESLKSNFQLIAVTNGTKIAQELKMNKTDITKFFEYIIISDDVGFNKPDIRFFYEMEKVTGKLDKETTIIIGDTLSSDILGGNNYGIDTCWFNPHNKKNDTNANVSFEIDNLNKFINYL